MIKTDSNPSNKQHNHIYGGGEMGDLMRSIDWSKTPVGEVSTWPQSLKTTVNMLLNSKIAMFLWWGPDLVQFYNDSYRPSFGTEGEKHPQSMGQKGAECWAEIWHIIYPQIKQVLDTGVPTSNENHQVPIYRNGILEEVYWTYSYNPVLDEDGKIQGVLAIITETTTEVITRRRAKLLSNLSVSLNEITEEQIAWEVVTSTLESSADIPFFMLYGNNEMEGKPELLAKAGLTEQGSVPLDRYEKLVESEIANINSGIDKSDYPKIIRLEPLKSNGNRHSALQVPKEAFLIPLFSDDSPEPEAFLIMGLNPMLLLDKDYEGFLISVSNEIGNLIGKIKNAEREKVRQLELTHARKETDNLKKRLLDLFMNTPAIMAVFSGPDLTCEIGNPPYRKLIGEDRAIDGRSLFDILPDLDEEIIKIIRNVADNGERFLSKEMPITLDWDNQGRAYTRFFELLYEPIYSNGMSDGVMAFAYDVTNHVRTRERLEEQNNVLKTIAEGSSLEDTLNALLKSIEKQSENNVRASILLMANDGKHLRHGAAPSLPSAYNKAVDGIAVAPNKGSCGTAAFIKEPVVVSDISRDPLWVDFKDLALSHDLWACWSTPIFSKGEEVLGTFALYYDSPQVPTARDKQLVDFATRTASLLIQRKLAKKALLESTKELEQQKRMYDSITGSTPDLVYVLDTNYRFVYANQAILDMWGKTMEEAMDKPMTELGYAPWQAQRHEREVDEVVASGKILRREVGFDHVTLGKRIYDYIFAPIFNSDSEVVAIAGTARDITDLKTLEEQKDRFIAIASHELKTPITSLKAYTQILQARLENDADSTASDFISKMDSQINKLTNLINDLLDITKMQNGQLKFNFQKFNINGLIREITEEVQRVTDSHQLNVSLTTDASVYADWDRIGQVLTNFLTNAIKYSPRHHSVNISSELSNGGITISVADFGMGIPDDRKIRIFEQFYRVEGSMRETLPGLGIGLFISKEIILRHEGKIWFESDEDKGSTFYFWLPVDDDSSIKISSGL